MKNIVLLVIFILGIVLFQYIQAHSVDEIIRKYLDARGGKQKLDTIRSVYMEGSRKMMGMELPVKITIVQNKLYRNDFEVDGISGFSIITPGEGWNLVPARSVNAEPISAEQLSAMQLQLDIAGPLLDYKGKGYKAELEGKEVINGKDAYKIKLTLHNNKEIIYYIDKETSLLVQCKQVNADDTSQEIITNFSDYNLFEGVMFPQTISNPGNDIMGGTTTFNTIMINNAVDENAYKPSA